MGGVIQTLDKTVGQKKYDIKKLKKEREKYFTFYWDYKRCYWKNFPFDIFEKISYIYKNGMTDDKRSYNDVIVMFDTETSKKDPDSIGENHVCAWSISLRAYERDICTLYGYKPSELIKCIRKIQESMKGDCLICYAHNLPYDWQFCRKFFFKEFGTPTRQLNIKPFYPIYIEFPGGLILRDSLILSQCKLEKWANDLDVQHKKETGKWNYNAVRHQIGHTLTEDEIDYIEHDTLAGVECLDAVRKALGKRICSMPWTMTGIVRERVKKAGMKHHAHDHFLKMLPTFEQQMKLEVVYHGGYTHGNRHFYGRVVRTKDGWDFIKGYDFSSSYPSVAILEKFPCEKFVPEEDLSPEELLASADDYAYMFKFVAYGIELISDEIPMPAMSASKCVRYINPIKDNGKIVKADLIEIYTNEVDLSIYCSMYKWTYAICTEVEVAAKNYLPKWFTDLAFDLFKEKTMLKGGDPADYMLAKGRLNSLYGMCCQHPYKLDILEEYEFTDILNVFHEREFKTPEERLEWEKNKYKEYGEKKGNVLNYQIGVWITSYAMRNLFRLGACVDYKNGGEWLYSDTDSCYVVGMDEKKLQAYNDDIKRRLTERGYGPVIKNDREYWLGIAEHDELEDTYSEFKFMGAKRYCGRCVSDNALHLTVSGVPKKPGAACLNDNIDNFTEGFIFPGIKTGKLTHTHFNIPEIYIDEWGNETGDSIDLSPCDYLLSMAECPSWDPFDDPELIEVIDYE